MYPINAATAALFAAEHKKVLRITGTGLPVTITDAHVRRFNVDRFSCVGEKLELGTATAAQMELDLDNTDGTFDSTTFEGMELFVEIGIADWTQANPTVTYIPVGYFTPDRQPRTKSIIHITALDRMTKFDSPVDGSLLTFPRTVAGLVGDVAQLCGVSVGTTLTTLANYDYSIDELPELQQEITYRTLIQWCAGIMGTCAFIDWQGKLIFQWYSAASYTCTPANRFDGDLAEADVSVTGVTYTNLQGTPIVSGTADYALDMTGNYLAGAGVATILPAVRTAIGSSTYRPFSASVIAAPYLWPLDMITYTDRDGNNHSCAVTNVNFGLNGKTALEGKGVTEQYNSRSIGSNVTRDQGFLLERAAEATKELDDSLTQQEIFNRLTDNGAAQGMVLYNGQLYINASYIQAGLLNAERINFNDPSTYFTIPDENNAASLFDGQTVEGGYIVSSTGSAWLTILRCDYAVLLRGMRITVTFTYKTSLAEVQVIFHSIDAQAWDTETIEVYDPGSPGNPYSYSFDVPNDCDYFTVAIRSAGVKAISASYSGTVTPDDSIDMNYAGLRVGGFFVNRDGYITTTGRNIFYGPTRFNEIFLNTPLDVSGGGTGANNAADARTNLGITPANIKAFGAASITGTVSDANNNTLYGTRFLKASDCANLPTNSSNHYYQLVCMGGFQMAFKYSSSGITNMYTRLYTNSQWYPWTGVALS